MHILNRNVQVKIMRLKYIQIVRIIDTKIKTSIYYSLDAIQITNFTGIGQIKTKHQFR